MEYGIYIVLGFILAVILGQRILSGILVISLCKHLFDIPDSRKVHHYPISRLGGISFLPVIVLVMCGMNILEFYLVSDSGMLPNISEVFEAMCLTIGLILLFLIGVYDDLMGVSYRQKFIMQIIASAFIPLSGLFIHHFYGLFSILEIPVWIGISLTMFFTVFVTNAINLIDGIDGLASGLSMEVLLFLGISFALNGVWMYSLFSFVCLGVLVPFFFYNVFGDVNRGRKLFMGDTGSLTLGFILSILSIKYIISTKQNLLMAVDEAPFVIIISLLFVPCLDMCRVVLERLVRKVNPFKPDKSHIHHLFLRMGYTQRRSFVLILLFSFFFIVLTFVLIHLGIASELVLFFDLSLWILANVWFRHMIKNNNV